MASNRRGFTLVELVIVVGIVGVLASIMLTGFSESRNVAKDARIKAEMTQLRLVAQYLRNDDLTYASSFVTPHAFAGCTPNGAAHGDLLTIGTNIRSLNGVSNCGPINNGELRIYASGTSFGATAKLASGTFWCVDSTGIEKGGYATRADALTDTTDYTCN